MESRQYINQKLLMLAPSRSLGIALFVVLAIALLGSCHPSTTVVKRPTLTVVTANMANVFPLNNSDQSTWQDRVDKFTALIGGGGVGPDIISMTESAGWTWSCGGRQTGDYDVVDRIISNLEKSTRVRYRVAYMVGAEGSFGFLGLNCHYYSGDTVLYNPNRLVNDTPNDVARAGWPQVAHNVSNVYGVQVRRSLPLCNRGTTLEPLEQLIDGPSQTDKCGRSTPSGPAWLLVTRHQDGSDNTPASLARFSVAGVAGSTFDVFTIHPPSGYEESAKPYIADFISGLTSPPYRSANPYYPTIVLGDYNALNFTTLNSDPSTRIDWPSGTKMIFQPAEDVMQVSLGNTSNSLSPVHNLQLDLGLALPTLIPCRPQDGSVFYRNKSFSDHCGLLVRFSE